jgi:outer membrane protein assembly factor BamB
MSVLLFRACAAAAVVATVAACASGDKPAPTPLETIAAPIAGAQAWSTRLGRPVRDLGIAVAGKLVVLASQDGTVLALDAASGREQWRAAVGQDLSAGVGSDGRFAAVVTQGNELVVLEAGRTVWRERINSRVATAPLVAGERVFVQGLDRVVQAFDAQDGRPLWQQQRPGDALSLAHGGVLMPFKDTLLTGFGAKLAGLDPLTGEARFEVAVASPRGTNEVERLADLVAPAARAGDVVCARAFQAAVSCINAERGSLAWTRPVGGTRGLAVDEQVLVGADATDRITAWQRANGDVAWSSERLRHRALCAPAILGQSVVFGDADGYLHFLSLAKGDLQLRLPTDGSAVVALVRAGDTLVAATSAGGVFGVRL